MATGYHGIAAEHVGPEGARGDRGTDESEDQARQEGAESRSVADQADAACLARHGPRRIRPRRAGPACVRAEVEPYRPDGVRELTARAYEPGVECIDQLGDDRHGRPAAPEKHRRNPARMGWLPVHDGYATHAASAGEGERPDSYSRRADDRLPEYR